jgi:hypothetical protein
VAVPCPADTPNELHEQSRSSTTRLKTSFYSDGLPLPMGEADPAGLGKVVPPIEQARGPASGARAGLGRARPILHVDVTG